MSVAAPIQAGRSHLAALEPALRALEHEIDRIGEWGCRLGGLLISGRRLLAVGNGGSAAQAQHLTAELVGRYCLERPPLSAIALHAESSSLTAISNDFGAEEVFARQVRAHGRPGDVLVALSTSGRSANILAAADAALKGDVEVWALTGPPPNPLADIADDSITVDALVPATIQEVHLVALHMLCAAVDEEVARRLGATS